MIVADKAVERSWEALELWLRLLKSVALDECMVFLMLLVLLLFLVVRF